MKKLKLMSMGLALVMILSACSSQGSSQGNANSATENTNNTVTEKTSGTINDNNATWENDMTEAIDMSG